MLVRARLFRWGGSVDSRRVAGSRRAWEGREGLLLVLDDDRGNQGLGEATPLPGLSVETVAEARRALEAYDWQSPDRSIDVLPASARFAVEAAQLDLSGRREGRPAAAVLSPTGAQEVPVNALVGHLDDAGTDLARLAAARGARTLKLKSAGRDLERDVAALARIREQAGPGMRLRIDLGGALAARDVPAWLSAFSRLDVEAVEEPCGGAALASLGRCAVPWLADESLADPEVRERLLASQACAGLVLKPTLLGGLDVCFALARRAKEADKSVTVTHTFDGPVALAASAALALACRADLAGLEAHAGLEPFPAWRTDMLDHGAGYLVTAGERPGLGLDAPRLDASFGEEVVLWER
jgi:L-alanine-DL-glutamate epimerase-like enolase superfamily enzyme